MSFLIACDAKDHGDQCAYTTAKDDTEGWKVWRRPGMPIHHLCPEHAEENL